MSSASYFAQRKQNLVEHERDLARQHRRVEDNTALPQPSFRVGDNAAPPQNTKGQHQRKVGRGGLDRRAPVEDFDFHEDLAMGEGESGAPFSLRPGTNRRGSPAVKRRRITGWLLALASLAAGTGLAQGGDLLIDDFESGLRWVAESSADSVALSITTDNATQGRHSLLVTFPNTGRDKVVIGHREERDLTSITGLVLDVTNPQTNAVDLAIALQTGGKWMWFETAPVSMTPGLNRNVRFILTGKTFKTERTQMLPPAAQYAEALENPGELRRVNILIFPGRLNAVALYLDNIRWEEIKGRR